MTNKTGAGELIVVVVCGCGSDTPAIGDAGSDSSTPNDAGGDVNVNPGDGGRSLTEFPSTSTMYQGVSSAPIDSAWNAILGGALANEWGNAFQLDPALTVNYADARVARRSFTKSPSVLPDCDTAPVPVPAGAMTEGYPDYFCATPGDDCHLLAYQGTRLYEVYQGTSLATGGTFTGSCLVAWDLTRDYWQPGTPFARGDGCNGADAADFPIAPLLLKKMEIEAHQINHAMRFTITNRRIDGTFYVHPTTHLRGSGPSGTTLPYRARLRLKKSFNVVGLPTPEAQTIAKALQTCGMFLADGGGFLVSAAKDVVDVMDTHESNAGDGSDWRPLQGWAARNVAHRQGAPPPDQVRLRFVRLQWKRAAVGLHVPGPAYRSIALPAATVAEARCGPRILNGGRLEVVALAHSSPPPASPSDTG